MRWSFFLFLMRRRILFYGDLMDPFCYIGFHNAKRAADAQGIPMEWHGFELNADTPKEGYHLETGGNSDLRLGMWASVKGLASQSGLHFPEPFYVPNTRKAHGLIELAKTRGVAISCAQQLYQAYFQEQKNIGDLSILIQIGGAVGFSETELTRAWSSDRLNTALESHRKEAHQRQFAGMPGFVYKGKNYFGALSLDAWTKILNA